jgi:hypothetical protein
MQDNLAPFDETADVLFKRGRVKPITTGLRIFDNDLPGGLKYGDVVELYGQANVGKTELLYQVVASCILPCTWRDIDVGGNGSGAVFFDNDYHFCMTRLIAILETKVRAAYSLHPASQSNPLPSNDIQDIVLASLHRLHIFKCRDSLQFLASLQSLHILLDRETNIKLLAIDSISAFHWLHRYEDTTKYQRQITHTVKRLANAYTLLLFATKGTSTVPKANDKDSDGSIIYKDYFANWDIVKYRLILTHSANKKFIAKLASPPTIQQTNSNSTSNTTTVHQASGPSVSVVYKYVIDETGLIVL